MRALLLASVLAAGSAAAQGVNGVFLDATYLGAPTDWCHADAGVPMVVKMDGPDIIKGPKQFPKTVIEKRGGNARTVFTGENITSFNRPGEFSGANAMVIGRFSAEFRTCLSPWGGPKASGSWRLTGTDGTDLGSGSFEAERFSSFALPFFTPVAGGGDVLYAKLGDRMLLTAPRPKTTITQTFAANPNKE